MRAIALLFLCGLVYGIGVSLAWVSEAENPWKEGAIYAGAALISVFALANILE